MASAPSGRPDSGREEAARASPRFDLLVNVDVADLGRAIAFYTEGLGLRLSRRLGPQAAELEGASSRVYLLEKRSGDAPFAGASMGRSWERHWTPVHLDLVVEAIEPALLRAEQAGARREGDIRESEWGRYVVLSDPFGNGFCLLQFLGRGYDVLEDRELEPRESS
jgi:lactoylglutathione lyase